MRISQYWTLLVMEKYGEEAALELSRQVWVERGASEAEVGLEFDVHCQMTEKKLLKNEHEVFLAYEPENYKLCFGRSRTRGRRGIKSFRWQICEPAGDNRTHLINYE